MYSTKNFMKGIALAMVFVMFQGMAMAAGPEKVVQKARAAVESAAPHDWETLAEAAESCFKNSTNWEEALSWAKQSVEIRATSYNLAVMGDYYLKNKMPTEAITYYIKSMNARRDADFYASNLDLQKKIVKAKKIRAKA